MLRLHPAGYAQHERTAFIRFETPVRTVFLPCLFSSVRPERNEVKSKDRLRVSEVEGYTMDSARKRVLLRSPLAVSLLLSAVVFLGVLSLRSAGSLESYDLQPSHRCRERVHGYV